MDIPRAFSDFIERARIVPPLLGDPSGNGVEAEARDLVALNLPGVCPIGPVDHPGHAVPVFGGEVVEEVVAHGGRLNQMIVDADHDHVL